MTSLKYRIVLKKDPEEEVYIVSAPSLPGCHTFGKTVEEAIEMAKEAIEGYNRENSIAMLVPS
jgi:predicted RNase H-like HicB family nuclease